MISYLIKNNLVLRYLFVLVKGMLLDFLFQPVSGLPHIFQDVIQHGPRLVLGKGALHGLLLVLLSSHQLHVLLFLLNNGDKNQTGWLSAEMSFAVNIHRALKQQLPVVQLC